MWICTTTGFMSATRRPADTIEAGDDRTIQVRARHASHLKHLRESMADHGATLGKTIKSKNADYQYRAFCTQDDLAIGMAALALEIDYTNFKNTVTDHKLHNAYMRIWSAVLDAFPQGSIYGWSKPRQRRGGSGRGRSAGLATEPIDWEGVGQREGWWEGGPSVDEEMAMQKHDANPFDALPAGWERG